MNMSDVVDYYFSTVNSTQPEGNITKVADHFKITRAKVHKILITMEAIDSPLHQDIIKLKDQGYSNADIAAMLGVSTATVSINLPYAKSMYGEEEKTKGAEKVDNFRNREKVFLAGQKRKPTYFDHLRELADHINKELSHYSADIYQYNDSDACYELEEDLMNLLPVYTTEESQFFQVSTDVVILHIELMGDFDSDVLKKYGGVQYGNTVSRDLLVHCDMPLHNLHYLIQQVFGFQNYHLHNFQLPEEQFVKIIDGKSKNWLDLMGVIFKNPLRGESVDFWDDNYDGGSPKKYMRSKYTGPYKAGVYEETYQWCRRDANRIKKIIKEQSAFYPMDNEVILLRRIFENDPCDLLERLTISDVLEIDDEPIPDSYETYMEEERDCIEVKKYVDVDDVNSQPFVYPVTDQLVYTYDYGDDWQFSITPVTNVQDLVESGRIKPKTLRDDIKHLCECQRPVLLAADGFNLVEDVGGPSGYCAFLNGIHGKDCGDHPYDEAIESLEWAKSLGWKDKVPNRSIV